MPNFEQNDLDDCYDGDWSQKEIERQSNIDYHRKHCARCWNDEGCKVLERLWNER